MDRVARLFRVVCASAIAAGIFFRVHDIDRKVYGVDETVTSLRVAGATLPDLRRDLLARRIPSLAAVRVRYQLVQPGSSYATTLESLERDD
ncbi:MAG: hypothetical protein IAI48_10090, partial [Candidatus Eremiobacteraeota bacterium]|nr:hypothetical protein [Candidatus Eremiobacteraeota bacterium]